MKRTIDIGIAQATALLVIFAFAACGGEAAEGGDAAPEVMTSAAESDEGDAAEFDVREGDAEEGDVREGDEGEGEHDAREGAEGEGEHGGREGGEEGEGEHSGEGGEGEHGGEGHDEEGEESGVYIAKDSTWDVVRRGARLILSFDDASGGFIGTVENTTGGQLCAVRVEVHLSTGTELGPTPRNDLPAGQTMDVTLSADGEAFESWTAHPEMSGCGG